MDARREGIWIATLLLALIVALVVGLRSDGLTIDEIVYIGSGHRHLALGDYRPNPEQPPLSKLLGALPLQLLRPVTPPWELGDSEWSWAYRFVHVANETSRLVGWARVPNVLLTVLLAVVLWAWARATAGPGAGLSALGLAAFHTSLIAHGHFLTTDLPGALTLLSASWAFWRWTRQPSLPRAALVGLLLGVAVATRLTGWLLVPTFAVLAAIEWRRAGLRATLAVVAAAALLVPATIWASYGFRYEPWPGASVAQPPGPWLGSTGRILTALQAARVLPEAYLEGMRFVAEHNVLGHPTYLLGKTSDKGWPHYYLVAFLVKGTPGFLAASLVGLGLALRRVGEWRERIHWLLPAAIVFLAASLGRIQIGERYILPVYPYLILLAASVTPPLLASARGRLVVAAVAAAHVVPSVVAAPAGYLSYFNLFAGGRAAGHRVLLDSNLDWGQDLPRLAAWMKAHGVAKVQLGYHGSDRPDRFGIRHEDLPSLHLYPAQPPAKPFTGTVAVSPNLLLGVFYPPGKNPYASLLARPPDDRAGVFFVYRLPEKAVENLWAGR